MERTNSLLIRPAILNRVGGERHIKFAAEKYRCRMSARWQKRHSSPHTSIEMSILITIHGQEYPCGSLGVQWRDDSTSFAQKSKNKHIEEYKIKVSLCLGQLSPKAAQLGAKKDPAAHNFPHQENHTLRGIVWYVNYITIKLFFKTPGFENKVIKNFKQPRYIFLKT